MQTNFLRTLPLLVLAAGAVTVVPAKQPVEAINTGRDKIALQGYDPVAYFNESKAVKGSSGFTLQWMGAVWQFSSAANRELFQQAPDRYAPQFGGYCSWAVGHNYTAPIDPEAWKIVDGKLYLNYSREVQKNWEKDQQKWIDEARKNWPGLHK